MKKKIMALALVAILAVTAIGGATLAYFTDVTEEVENTFTVGNVNIDLDEPKWDPQAKHNLLPGVTFAKDPTITVEEGSDDCWIFMEVEMNKFNSWLRLVGLKYGFFKTADDCQLCGDGKCEGHITEELLTFIGSDAYQAAINDWFAGVDHANWKIMNLEDVKADILKSFTDDSITTIKPIFAYKAVQKAGESKTLFTSVTMPAYVTDEDLALAGFNTDRAKWTLTFKAHAIQAAEIGTVDAAYAALFN